MDFWAHHPPYSAFFYAFIKHPRWAIEEAIRRTIANDKALNAAGDFYHWKWLWPLLEVMAYLAAVILILAALSVLSDEDENEGGGGSLVCKK